MAQTDRDILFANESFLIGVLQAVSGASLVAGVSQAEALVQYAGRLSLSVFLTTMGLALIAAVLAAYWKHQYKMWDVKAQASATMKNQAEAHSRLDTSNTYLNAMRRAMFWAVAAIVLGVAQLVVAFWANVSLGNLSGRGDR